MTPLKVQSPELHNNAHTHFARMRREEPVYRARYSSRRDVYLVTRYADVKELLKGDQLVKDPANSTLGRGAKRLIEPPKPLRSLMNGMLTSDDPEHRRLRKLVSKAFTPKTIGSLEESMEEITDRLIGDMAGQKEVDLITAFALPFPVHVITELVGVPPKDRARFQRWVHAIVLSPNLFNMVRIVPALWKFMRYVRQLSDEKRTNPGEDLLSELVQIEDEGDHLSKDELVAMVFLLLIAGHETTVSLIANGTLALLTHPEELEKLRMEPELIGSAVEEMLRFDGPLLTTDPYYARKTFTLHGVTIDAGEAVLPALLSANRDEEVFDSPHSFDITRSPNKHLAFGTGIHHCLGAALARLEAKVAFTTLLTALPQLRLARPPEDISYRSNLFLHRLEALPVIVS